MAAISVITSVLAVQALWTPLNQHQVAVAVAALVLVPSLWASSIGVYLSRRRSVVAYMKARQRLSELSGNASDILWERAADGALATNGKVVGFTAALSNLEPDAGRDREVTLEKANVQVVIRDRKLRTLYQPIVSMIDDRVIGAEALTRFSAEPEATPDVWFARAADVGLGIDLEILALSVALESAGELPDDIYLSINLSPDALADSRVATLLQKGSWPCDQLVIEVTEHVSVTDYASLADTVATLRRLGVRIAVDDAGAGYASFRHILKLRPDYIKLDRALIDGIDRDAAKRALAGAFVAFGEELDVFIVAEGVETAAELSAARALGVHAAQGFHTGRPAPPSDSWGL